MSRRVLIEGAAGTVGMALLPYLPLLQSEGLIAEWCTLVRAELSEEAYHAARLEQYRWADLVVLCLPDEAATQAVALIQANSSNVRILDASAAHRCAVGWAYGLAEVTPEREIAQAQYVANPGCFATGCILLGRPIAARLRQLSGADHPAWLAFQGITGYTAAGQRGAPDDAMPRLTQFGAQHRHLPEIARYAEVSPALTTMIGPWAQGMLVQTTVPLDEAEVLDAYRRAYAGRGQELAITRAHDASRKLSATECNGTNQVRILVASQPYGGTAVAACYDNLGKGSAGAAAQNLRLMLS